MIQVLLRVSRRFEGFSTSSTKKRHTVSNNSVENVPIVKLTDFAIIAQGAKPPWCNFLGSLIVFCDVIDGVTV